MTAPFPERADGWSTPRKRRRTDAAAAWLDEAFAVAREDSANAVALVVHGNIGIDRELEQEVGFDPFLERLEVHVSSFDGQVLLIHGDSHIQRVDHPFRRRF